MQITQEIKDFIDNILDCVIVIDSSYNIQKINRETELMLGYREAQIIGKKMDCILGEYIASRWEDFRRLLTKWPVRNSDSVLKKLDGSEFPVKMNSTPINDNGFLSGWFITAKDMSSTRNLIRELARSQKQLQGTVRELEESRDELIRSEKLSFAGRMAASVAHEIRNPLNIIGMAIQQLHNELRVKDPKREYTNIIMNHISRVSKLIDEFVNLARPPKLKMQLKNINIILEDVMNLMQAKISGCKAKLIKEFDLTLPKILVDEEHITQAFTNLLMNACDAIPKRQGTIYVTTKKYEDRYAAIIFRNNGKPILEKDLIKIFDPFFTTKKAGTGLGLGIAYGIIGSHRGGIDVESNKKKGTIFTVKLPIYPPPKKTWGRLFLDSNYSGDIL